MLVVVCALLVSAGPELPELKRAEDSFAAYKWADAQKALAKARATRGLTRMQLLRILELQGVAAAQQRQGDAAQKAFTELLTLDPDHKLETEYAPKVMTPFYEARRAATERGALDLTASATVTTESVQALQVRVVKDPLSSVKVVRFHVGPKVTPVAPAAGLAELKVSGGEVSWWAEALGDNETQLLTLGSADAPRVERRVPPAVVAAPPPPLPAPPPPPVVAKKGSGVRTASYVVLAAAAVAGGAGGYFGWRSGTLFGALEHAERDSAGHIISITEREAYAMSAEAGRYGLIANGLYAAAGALAIVAIVMWLVGAP